MTKAWLRLFNPDRAIASVDGEQVSAAVHFSMDILVADTSLHRNRHVHIDVTVAGVQVNVSGKVVGQLQGHTAVAGTKAPTRSHGRTSHGAGFDVTIPGVEVQGVKSSGGPNVPVSGVSAQAAIDGFNLLMAVATLQFHVALEIRQSNGAVTGMQTDSAFPRHVD